jgi:ribosome maturation factor rimP
LYQKFINKKKEELMAKIEEKVEQLVKDPIEKLGYSLYDVEYVKEGPEYYLRIYIDKESGIDLNDCEKVSNEINEILDKADYIKEQYYLEVSSPGIERKLRKDKHLEQNISKNVEIKLFKKDNNGKKEYIGKLKAFNQEEIIIETDKEITIERKNIAQIKTIYEW